jgi:hypothetical protein
MDWFLKLILPLIDKDVPMTMPGSEDESIQKERQHDLIYAQSGYLYMILFNAPHSH